jgi:epoxide hydrolase-like predicted phosphatase
MSIRAVYVDLGGVLLRTEDRIPRTCLAESLGLTKDEIENVVFASKSSAQASVGAITSEQHWRNVVRTLNLPESEIPRVRDQFFAGDRLDAEMVDFLRGLRRASVRTGLISNAWNDLRAWIVGRGFEDAFDVMVISAETGLVKPGAGIYRLALEKLDVAPAEAVFVDDMPENVDGARAVGMHAIQFSQSKEVLEEIRRLLADHR